MDTRAALVVDAFTDDPGTGTPVGVVPSAGDLSEDQRDAIAADLGPGATVFVEPSESADRRIRVEGDGAGAAAATVAVHSHLFDRAVVDDGTHAVETADGVVDAEVTIDGGVWLERPSAAVEAGVADPTETADALGIDGAAVRGVDLPVARVEAGRPLLAVPVTYFEHVTDLAVDPGAFADLLAETEAEAAVAFTFDTLDGAATIHARPLDSRGGDRPLDATAATAVAAHCRRQSAFDGEYDPIEVEGGQFVDRPAWVSVETDGQDVRVGGRAVTVLDGDLVVPDPTDDDIIEA